MKIKTILTTALVAIFAVISLGATRTAQAEDPHYTDVENAFYKDNKAIEESLIKVRCEYGLVTNSYKFSCTGTAEGDGSVFSLYKLSFPNLHLKNKQAYEFVCQKVSGPYNPHFTLELELSNCYRRYVFADLEDGKLNACPFSFKGLVDTTPPVLICDFEHHSSGTTEIEGYLREAN